MILLLLLSDCHQILSTSFNPLRPSNRRLPLLTPNISPHTDHQPPLTTHPDHRPPLRVHYNSPNSLRLTTQPTLATHSDSQLTRLAQLTPITARLSQLIPNPTRFSQPTTTITTRPALTSYNALRLTTQLSSQLNSQLSRILQLTRLSQLTTTRSTRPALTTHSNSPGSYNSLRLTQLTTTRPTHPDHCRVEHQLSGEIPDLRVIPVQTRLARLGRGSVTPVVSARAADTACRKTVGISGMRKRCKLVTVLLHKSPALNPLFG